MTEDKNEISILKTKANNAEVLLEGLNRKTDSLLDWLGAWGGFLDGLNFVGGNLLSPYSAYSLNSALAFLIVRFIPSGVNNSST